MCVTENRRAFLSQMQKCPFQRANSLVCFFPCVCLSFLIIHIFCIYHLAACLYNVIPHVTLFSFCREVIRPTSLSWGLNWRAAVWIMKNLFPLSPTCQRWCVNITTITMHLFARPWLNQRWSNNTWQPNHLVKKTTVLSLSHSLCYTFCQRCWSFSKQNKVLHYGALSAHVPKWVGYLK